MRTKPTNHLPLVRTEDIIDAQRREIAAKMDGFEYTEQMKELSALTPETNGQPLQSGKFSFKSNVKTNHYE